MERVGREVVGVEVPAIINDRCFDARALPRLLVLMGPDEAALVRFSSPEALDLEQRPPVRPLRLLRASSFFGAAAALHCVRNLVPARRAAATQVVLTSLGLYTRSSAVTSRSDGEARGDQLHESKNH